MTNQNMIEIRKLDKAIGKQKKVVADVMDEVRKEAYQIINPRVNYRGDLPFQRRVYLNFWRLEHARRENRYEEINVAKGDDDDIVLTVLKAWIKEYDKDAPNVPASLVDDVKRLDSVKAKLAKLERKRLTLSSV